MNTLLQTVGSTLSFKLLSRGAGFYRWGFLTSSVIHFRYFQPYVLTSFLFLVDRHSPEHSWTVWHPR
jgi:hypothetical protein